MADYGLDRGRTLRRAVGNATAEITLADHGSVQMRWVTAKGARQKTAPASVRRDDPESVATLVTLARDIARMVVVQRERVEGLLREEERRWDFAAWRARYGASRRLGHSAAAHLATAVGVAHQHGDRA